MRDSFLFGLPTDSLTLPEGAALSYFHSERSEESLGRPFFAVAVSSVGTNLQVVRVFFFLPPPFAMIKSALSLEGSTRHEALVSTTSVLGTALSVTI